MSKYHFFYRGLILSITAIFFLSGCSARHFLGHISGTYVSQPKEGEEGRYSRSFDCSYSVCYEEVQKILKEMGVVIFIKDKKGHMFSAMYFDKIYKHCIDTTEVGIFFKEIAPWKIQVDVACGDYNLAKFASKEIFSHLEKNLHLENKGNEEYY